MMSAIDGVMLALSEPPAASIAAKETVIIALAFSAWLARRSRAAVRHALLAASFGVLLLLPVASHFAPPIRIAVAAVKQEPAVPALAAGANARSTVALPDAGIHAPSSVPQSSRPSLSAMLLMGWIAGTGLFPKMSGGGRPNAIHETESADTQGRLERQI